MYSERVALIRQSLMGTGLTDGRNVAIEYRWTEGQLDRLPVLGSRPRQPHSECHRRNSGLQAPRCRFIGVVRPGNDV
jgi:hypothetical protein